jgi:hypothetical protein
MDPADSKNYTCTSETSATEKGKNVKSDDSYTHYIIGKCNNSNINNNKCILRRRR